MAETTETLPVNVRRLTQQARHCKPTVAAAGAASAAAGAAS